MYNSKNNSTQLLLRCGDDGLEIIVADVPWNKRIQLVLQLPNDDFPQGRCYLFGSYNGVYFNHGLATEDYIQQQIQGTINASYYYEELMAFPMALVISSVVAITDILFNI